VDGLATHGTERLLPWFPIVHQNEFHVCLHKKQGTSDPPSTQIVAPSLRISIERGSNCVATWFARYIPRFARPVSRSARWHRSRPMPASGVKHRKQSQ
jgi:hypothetical protein